jgi:hypothetical protein
MKVRIAVFALALLLASGVFAQQPATLPAPNDGVNATVSTEYIHFTNGLTGTMIEARRPITDYWSLGYAQVIVPAAKSNFYLLGPRYDTDLAHIFKKAKPSKLDLSLIKVFAGAGLGTRRDDMGGSPAFAYGVHAGIGIASGKLLGADVGFNVSTGFLSAAKQNPNGPRNFAAFSSVVNGDFAVGVTLKF